MNVIIDYAINYTTGNVRYYIYLAKTDGTAGRLLHTVDNRAGVTKIVKAKGYNVVNDEAENAGY